LVGGVSVADCEEGEAFIGNVEEDSVVDFLAFSTDFESPYLSL
jgi:hypothetical protein